MTISSFHTISGKSLWIFAYFLFLLVKTSTSLSFKPMNEMKMNGVQNRSHKEIYGIPGSGWTSSQWNWGSAMGTGHDCAMICRDRYSVKSARVKLITSLLNPPALNGSNDEEIKAQQVSLLVEDDISMRQPSFEEVKLILGLAWQNGRWDGSDGGIGGYGDVLRLMAKADKYEGGYDEQKCIECNNQFIQDVLSRFHLIAPADQVQNIKVALAPFNDDVDAKRRICSGMILKAMGFIDKGL